MKKPLIYFILVILINACGQTGIVPSLIPGFEPKPYNLGKRDIVKLDKDEKSIFDSCKIYLVEIDTAQISYWDRGIRLDKSKTKDYKIYEEMVDWFDLESTDQHKYKSPELFFADEFNKNFLKGFRYGEGKYLNISTISYYDVNDGDLEIIKKELPTNPKKMVELSQPIEISEFCKTFKQKHKDADLLILNSGMGITLGTFDGFTPSYFQTNKKRACAILIPKTIIDLKQEKIVAYFLEQNNLYYYSGIKTIKEGMIEEFEEVGKSFNSDFLKEF